MKKKRTGIVTLQEALVTNEIKKPSTVARGVNPRHRSLEKKRTDIVTTQQYNKDLSACVMSDVLVIDNIRQAPFNALDHDGFSTEKGFSARASRPVAGKKVGTNANSSDD